MLALDYLRPDVFHTEGLGGVTAGATLDVMENAVSNIICQFAQTPSSIYVIEGFNTHVR